jgi:ferrous-iron efflux pump FieF
MITTIGQGARDCEGEVRLRKWATYASTTVGTVLVLAKIAAWLMTGSVSVLSSLVDSFLDIAASVINLLAVTHAVTPADHEHRFGHGKAEPLAGLGQSAFIGGSAVLLCIQAVQRFWEPVPVERAGIGIAVMGFSILLALGLVQFQRRVVRRTGSVAIRADELHYRGDIFLNASVILSLVISAATGWSFIDPLFGLGIAGWIIWSAWEIVQASLVQLMDRELPDPERLRIRNIALSHPEVRSVHDLRTRAAGPTEFVQLHVELDGGMTLAHAHEVSDEVEARILAAYPRCEVIIHQDPAGVAESHRRAAAAVRSDA